MGNAMTSMKEFEQTFGDRQSMGFNIELDDPFQPFNEDPSQKDLVPGFGEPKQTPADRGWLSSYSRMLNAIDTGGVFQWTDMVTASRGDARSAALSAILDDAAYSSGLIGDGLRGLKDLGSGDYNNIANEISSPGYGLKDSPSIDGLIKDSVENNSNVEGPNNVGMNSNNKSANESSIKSNLVNTTESFTDEDIVNSTMVSGRPLDGGPLVGEHLDQLRQLTVSNSSSDGSSWGIDSNSSRKVFNLTKDNGSIETVGVVSKGNFSEILNVRDKFDGSDENMIPTETYGDDRIVIGDSNRGIETGTPLFQGPIPMSDTGTKALHSKRVRRQASSSSGRGGSPPPWAMGPQMAIPSSPGARGPPSQRPNPRAFPMPNRPPSGQSQGMNGSPFGRNPMMGGPQFPNSGGPPFGGPQQFGSPRGQQFPPGMMPQQFPGGGQSSRVPNRQPFGSPRGSQMGQNPRGLPGQNPFGQPNQNPFGQAGQDPFGQRGQPPFGQPGQNPFGQPSRNPFGQPSQNAFGQPNQMPFGQPSQNSFGSPSQNPFGQQGQNPFGQQGQNPFGQQNQNPFGPQSGAFGPPNRNPFESPSSFPVPPGAGGGSERGPSGLSESQPPPPPSLPTGSDDFDAELELKPSPFESLGSFPMGPPSSSSNSFGSSSSSPSSGKPMGSGQQNPFSQPPGFSGGRQSMGFGQPNQMMGSNPFQQKNPFTNPSGSNSQFGFPSNMPGMPPQYSQMGGFPGMSSPFGQNGFGNQQGMSFMGGNQFGSRNGRNPFMSGTGTGSSLMSGFPGMTNPFMSSSPFGRSSRYPPSINPFGSPMGGMRNPLSSRSMNPFSSPFSSMRGGFPGMGDMRGMPGSRPMRPPRGGFPTMPMGSRSRSRG